MADHEIAQRKLQRFPGGSYAANCTCAWFGPIRANRGDAFGEWEDHARKAYARTAEKSIAAAVKACA